MSVLCFLATETFWKSRTGIAASVLTKINLNLLSVECATYVKALQLGKYVGDSGLFSRRTCKSVFNRC